jgi:putative transposase
MITGIVNADFEPIIPLLVSGSDGKIYTQDAIVDTGWYQFRVWLEYFGKVFGRATVAVNPAYTSQECSSCGVIVKKSLSTRTHVCQCGCVLDRDENAAINILNRGLSTVGHTGRSALDADNAWGDSIVSPVGENLLGQIES